jgi:hypothetical protein
MSLGEQWGIGLVSTAHFRPAATGGPYSQLVLIPIKTILLCRNRRRKTGYPSPEDVKNKGHFSPTILGWGNTRFSSPLCVQK